MTSKAKLRRLFLKSRRSLSSDLWRAKSDLLIQELVKMPLFEEARTILAYFSFNQEPDLSPLFSDSSRRWGFSRCVEQSLFWHYWQPPEPLKLGAFGIYEPYADSLLVLPHEVDLILVPAVACDERGYRLGYGGGFYDRMLSDPIWAKIPAIAIVFEEAFVPQLPKDFWDQRLYGVCTDTRTCLFI